MNMKKEIMAAIAAVLAIWFFVMGFELGIYKERRAQAKLASQNPQISTTAPSILPTFPTVAPVTPGSDATAPTAESTMPTVPGNDVTVAPSGKEITSLSTDEILSDVGNAINTLKQTPNFTALRRLQVVVQVVDCSVPSAIDAINGIINDVTSTATPEETLVFTNGVAVNTKGEQLTPFAAVPPENNSFTLTSAGVASARAEKQGDNKVYYINLNPESTTGDNPIPVNNAGSLGFLNIESLGLPSIVKITRANMNYPGSMMQVTVDKDGKLIHLKNYLPMTGDGEAKVGALGGSAKFEGYLNEEWSIAY